VPEYRAGFFITTVTYYFDDYQTSYYEAINGQDAVYNFRLDNPQKLFVQLDFYA
jgi:hypothetical protein